MFSKRTILLLYLPATIAVISAYGLVRFLFAYDLSLVLLTSHLLSFVLVLLTTLIASVYAMRHTLKHPKGPYQYSLKLTLLCIPFLFWLPALLLGGWVFGMNVWYYIVFFALTAFFTYYFAKTSRVLSGAFLVLTIVVVAFPVISNIEESYCWEQGRRADPTGTNTVIATREDAENLKVFEVKEGAQIGVSFREQMKCHREFDISDVLRFPDE